MKKYKNRMRDTKNIKCLECRKRQAYEDYRRALRRLKALEK